MTVQKTTSAPSGNNISGTQKTQEESLLSALKDLVRILFQNIRSFDFKAAYKTTVEYPYEQAFREKIEAINSFDYTGTAKRGAVAIGEKIYNHNYARTTGLILDVAASGIELAANGLRRASRHLKGDEVKTV